MILILVAVTYISVAALITPPGAVNPVVTQATIGQTVCKARWATSVRPRKALLDKIKRRMVREQGVATTAYELDHFIPLELGGAPLALDNLWLEPWPHAHKKDVDERRYNRAVCHHTMTLDAARAAFVAKWRQP